MKHAKRIEQMRLDWGPDFRLLPLPSLGDLEASLLGELLPPELLALVPPTALLGAIGLGAKGKLSLRNAFHKGAASPNGS